MGTMLTLSPFVGIAQAMVEQVCLHHIPDGFQEDVVFSPASKFLECDVKPTILLISDVRLNYLYGHSRFVRSTVQLA